MDAYSVLRHFADSWGLLAMTLAFLAAGLWAFRPGARAVHLNAAAIPFRHDSAPAPDVPKLSGDCTGCGLCGGRCGTKTFPTEH